MYAQAAIKPNTLLRNGAYGIVMRGVQKCTCAGASLRGRNSAPLCCIKLDTATEPYDVSGIFFLAALKNMLIYRIIHRHAGESQYADDNSERGKNRRPRADNAHRKTHSGSRDKRAQNPECVRKYLCRRLCLSVKLFKRHDLRRTLF